MSMMSQHHFLVVSLPAQGHLNPTLQLAKILARNGSRATFATTVLAFRRLKTSLPVVDGLSYASFSDGYDDESSRSNFNLKKFIEDLERVGSQTLTNLLKTLSDEGKPVTFLIYTVMLPWAASVARGMHVPSALLFIQCATSFSIIHHFFNTHDGVGTTNFNPSTCVKLPGLPLFSSNDLPTTLNPTNQYSPLASTFEQHMKVLEQETNPCVLFNTFDALENEQFKSIATKILAVPIGPLVPSAFLSNGKNDQKDNSFGCDLFESNTDYLKWLDSRENNSVVYISFGSLAQIQKEQSEEILHGVAASGKPFLFVIRSASLSEELKASIEQHLTEDNNGLILQWCDQLQVLSHQSIGCFVTHCGWNSTLESMVYGVPIVGCPQLSDQPTNAKLVEEVWGNGVRAVADENGVVERKEITKCLEIVMGDGERGEEIRKNALKWKSLAEEAVEEGGSSYNNLKMFLEKII